MRMISINSSYTKGQRSKKEQRGYKTEKNALTRFDGCDIILQWYFEVWLSLVERCVRDAEAVGSSPVTSTKKKIRRQGGFSFCTFLFSLLSLLSSLFSNMLRRIFQIKDKREKRKVDVSPCGDGFDYT